jgi:hypothetical protein
MPNSIRRNAANVLAISFVLMTGTTAAQTHAKTTARGKAIEHNKALMAKDKK